MTVLNAMLNMNMADVPAETLAKLASDLPEMIHGKRVLMDTWTRIGGQINRGTQKTFDQLQRLLTKVEDEINRRATSIGVFDEIPSDDVCVTVPIFS